MWQVAKTEGSSFEEHLQTLPKKNRNRLAAALLAKVRCGRGGRKPIISSSSCLDTWPDAVLAVKAVVRPNIGRVAGGRTAGVKRSMERRMDVGRAGLTRAIRAPQVNGVCDKLPTLFSDDTADLREVTGLATLARLMVTEEGTATPRDVHAASVRLHDDALLDAEQHPALQEAVATLCEAWWKVPPPHQGQC